MLKRYGLLIGLLAIVMIAGSLWSFSSTPAMAQDSTNLLSNGGFERPYYAQAEGQTIPNGWLLRALEGDPDAFPHPDPLQVLDGSDSWNLKQGYVKFTAVGYQQVSGLTEGEGVRFTAYGWVYTCNNTVNSCGIDTPPYRQSDPSAGASLRVGIDPLGGTDPNASQVKWSSPTAPYDQWAEMSVAVNAESTTVTVFIYMTQSAGLALNNVYWDKASLIRTEVAPDATEVPAFVPFVVPQNVRPDGSIVHVVQANDTLSSIAFAYADYGVTNESIAELNGIKPNARFLQIGQELVILPPGSLDPTTGQPVAAGGNVAAPVATLAPVATVAPAGTAVAAQPLAPATGQTTTSDMPPVTYVTVRGSFYPFEQGFMFWLQDTNKIYVLVNVDNALGGTYSEYVDTWREGMPETDETIVPPAGFTQPERNFGHAWRTYPGVRDALGWGTGSAQDYTALVVHDGETVVISSPDNRVYQLTALQTWSAMDHNQP